MTMLDVTAALAALCGVWAIPIAALLLSMRVPARRPVPVRARRR